MLDIPPDALCRSCNYPLRDLAKARWPECGGEFDPARPETMNSRDGIVAIKQRLMRPPGKATVAAAEIASVLLLYFDTLLPMSGTASIVGILLVIFVAIAWPVRLAIRTVIAVASRRSLIPARGEWRPWLIPPTLAIAVGVALWWHLPLRGVFVLARPALEAVATQAVAHPNARVTESQAGPFRVLPRVNGVGVWLEVPDAFSFGGNAGFLYCASHSSCGAGPAVSLGGGWYRFGR